MKTFTDSQYYRGINRRFDKRAKLLGRFGFKYSMMELPEINRIHLGVFYRNPYQKGQAIAAGAVLYADRRGFLGILRNHLS